MTDSKNVCKVLVFDGGERPVARYIVWGNIDIVGAEAISKYPGAMGIRVQYTRRKSSWHNRK